MFPPPGPDPRVLADVRSALRDAGYTEAGAAAKLGVPSLYDFALGVATGRPQPPEDGVDVLVRLFLEGGAVARARAAETLPQGLLVGLENLELLAADGENGGSLRSPVALYPVEGLYIASDLDTDDARGDAVYPAITKSVMIYLSSFPRTPCGRFLELCSGTGIGALAAAPAAERAWAVDITGKSTDYARFNAALNGLSNVVALQGDLYDPVSGMEFDRIVAHPPYVPALEQRQIFRDGGADGEQVTRGVLRGARAHLAPGGRLYCTCVATEREGEALEQRARAMLGPEGDDCDVAVFVSAGTEPLLPFLRQVVARRMPLPELGRFIEAFEHMKITQFVGCTIVVERHSSPRPPLTLRRRRSDRDLGGSLDAVLYWESVEGTKETLERVLELRPKLAPRAHLEATHVARDGAWQLVASRIAVDAPLPVELATSPEAAGFLAWCDGAHTVRELLQRLIAEGAAPPDMPPETLAGMVLGLLKESVLEAEDPGPAR